MDMRPLHFEPGCNTPEDVIRAQFRANVERDLPWLEEGALKDRPLAIVAGGPSLSDYLGDLSGADVMALNNAYSYLLDRQITPDYFMLLDARKENVEFLRKTGDTKHFIAAQCHPDVFDALLGDDVVLYLTTLPYAKELTAHINKLKHLVAGNVGTVGIKALCLGYALGYRHFVLYGYDSSYRDDQHHAFPQSLNDNANTLDVWINKDGKAYKTTPTLAHQATEFCQLAGAMVRHYGCTIDLRCEGLLPDMVRASNERGEIPLEVRERHKYETMWASNVYRKEAPGESYIDLATEMLDMHPGETVVDFGCGTGRGARRWQERGYRVVGVDFAKNCLDPDVQIEFVEAPLWDLPAVVEGQYGYCTDVMEHIPMERVLDVLKQIKERVVSCFFAISTTDDNLGYIAGHKLHMTVVPANEWIKIMRSVWPRVKWMEADGCVCIAAS
jgi:hypothetical protein